MLAAVRLSATMRDAQRSGGRRPRSRRHLAGTPRHALARRVRLALPVEHAARLAEEAASSAAAAAAAYSAASASAAPAELRRAPSIDATVFVSDPPSPVSSNAANKRRCGISPRFRTAWDPSARLDPTRGTAGRGRGEARPAAAGASAGAPVYKFFLPAASVAAGGAAPHERVASRDEARRGDEAPVARVVGEGSEERVDALDARLWSRPSSAPSATGESRVSTGGSAAEDRALERGDVDVSGRRRRSAPSAAASASSSARSFAAAREGGGGDRQRARARSSSSCGRDLDPVARAKRTRAASGDPEDAER